jgi:glycosyltransferase involved in cell wall biosynthesis
MRIMFIANRFDASARGGVENYFSEAARWYAAAGYDVSVISRQWSPDDPCMEKIGDACVKRFSLPEIRHLGLFLKPTLTRRHIQKQLQSMIADERPDCIITRMSSWATAAINTAPACPIIYIPSSVDRLIGRASGARSLKDILFSKFWRWQTARMEKYAMRHSSATVVFSKTIRDQLCGLYQIDSGKFHLLPPGVDAKRFCPGNAQDLRLSHGIAEDEPVVLSVCRLSREKALDSVISCISGKESWRWVIVGDGPERKRLQGLAAELGERVIFTGVSNTPERWYQAADIFLLPSVYETFGQVLLEAMASGLPCVARKRQLPQIDTASEEIIDHMHTGLVVDDTNAGALIAAINQLVEDKECRETFGRNGRQKAVGQFGWNSHFQGLVELWKGAI